jgi:hypothetical protein
MDFFIAHMQTPEGERHFRAFAVMGRRLVDFIETLPLGEAWVQQVLRTLGLSTCGPPGDEQLRRDSDVTTNLLQVADNNQWDRFCRWMWYYTAPVSQERTDVFQKIVALRGVGNLEQLTTLEELCRDFNRQLGLRCALFMESELRTSQHAAKLAQTELDRLRTHVAAAPAARDCCTEDVR